MGLGIGESPIPIVNRIKFNYFFHILFIINKSKNIQLNKKGFILMKNISNISEINIIPLQDKSILNEKEENNNLLRQPNNLNITTDFPCKYSIFI